MEITETHYVFEDDNEFIDKMLNKEMETHRDENGGGSFNISFNTAYDEALKKDKQFYIKDKDSNIMRRGVVTMKSCCLPVDNLDDFYPDKEYFKARGKNIDL